MNNWTIAGRLGGDAETRYTQGGDAVTNFSVAVDGYAKGQRTTEWVKCALWGERGEKLAEFLRKGTPVSVSGEAGFEMYEGREGMVGRLTMRVNSYNGVTLLGSRQDAEGGHRQASERPAGGGRQAPAQQRGGHAQGAGYGDRKPASPPPAPPSDDFSDEDIPF